MNNRLKADGMLLVVTLCWGMSYYLMDLSLTELDPFNLNALRFLGAFAVAALLSWKKLKTVSRATLKYSLFVGFALFLVYIGATFGVMNTSLSNSGFLCAMTVVFTPLISWVFLKKRPEGRVTLAVFVCFVGIAMLTLTDNFSINIDNLKGDLLCRGCAMFYAIDLLISEKAVSQEVVDPYKLGLFQLGVTGVLNLIMSILTETPGVPVSGSIWASVIFLSIFCTGVAFVIQPIAQQYTTASHVGIIYSLEPVFAGIVAFALAHEVLTTKAYFGAVLMIASIFIMEIDFEGLKKRKGIHGEGK